jgi:uncharacterized delta-60 repeat protein
MKRGARRILRRSIGVFVLFWALHAPAQTPAPLAIANVPVGLAGSVAAIVRLPDGGMIIGGRFTLVDGIPRNNIARLKPDGMLDPNWDADADGSVDALAVGPDGDIFAGGFFTRIGGQARSLIAKLSADGRGAADAAWNPGVRVDDDSGLYGVLSLAVDARGSVYAGGFFHAVNGLPRNFFVRLSGQGAGDVDVTWTPAVDTVVQALTIDSSGMVYAGLQTDVYRPGIARFSSAGGGARDALWTPSLNGDARALAVDADGNLYAAGGFQKPTNQNSIGLLRFPRDDRGEADPNWNPAYQTMSALAVDAAGIVYAAGAGVVARISTRGATGEGDWTSTTGYVSTLALDASGALYVGGEIAVTGGQPSLGLARLSASSGAVEPTADVEVPGEVHALARQANGGIIVGGYFVKAGAARRNNLFRIDANGTLDSQWAPSPVNWIVALAVDANDDVYAGGYPFDAEGNLIKLDGGGSGAPDPTWNPAFAGEVYCLAVDAEGALYVGGSFSSIGGTSQPNLAKFPSGSDVPDARWQPSIDSPIVTLLVDGDSIYAGGDFISVSNQSVGAVAKLARITGALDTTWNTQHLSGLTRSLARASDGSLYVGGDLGTSEHRDYLVKLAPDGTQDPLWNADPDDEIYAVALGSDGAVYAAGTFRAIGRQQRMGLAKLSPSTGDADPAWDATTDGDVATLFTDDNALYVGGYFSTLGGELRGSIGALPAAKPGNGSLLRGHSQHALPIRFSPPTR